MDSPKRKALRLPDYDYSRAGAYFVTICTAGRKSILSRIAVGAGVLDGPELQLTEIGQIAEERIREMNAVYPDRNVEKYVIMPNHVHLLISISAHGPSGTPAPTNEWIPRFVSTFKRFTNREAGQKLWQRGYYEHVIRDSADYLRIWSYIDSNPFKWEEDQYYSAGS